MPLSKSKRWPEKTISPEEEKAMESAGKYNRPRYDYVEGIRKLNFRHKFKTGEILEATEDKSGFASIIIKRGDKIVLDFSTLTPPEFKFITPTYLKQIGEKDRGEWGAYPWKKLLSVGDMRSPDSIFALMHEISHTPQELTKEQIKEHCLEEWPEGRNELNLSIPKLIQDWSASERNAWVNAILMSRKIKKEHGINLFELFDNLSDFKKFMYGSLVSHRFGKEQALYESNHNLTQRVWENLNELLFGKERGSEERKFMEKLFDKGRLRRQK